MQLPALLQSTGSGTRGLGSCGSQVLEHRLGRCGAWAQLLHGMGNLPGPRIGLMSPALAGRFFTREAPVGVHLFVTIVDDVALAWGMGISKG